jgi:hypothetical protein
MQPKFLDPLQGHIEEGREYNEEQDDEADRPATEYEGEDHDEVDEEEDANEWTDMELAKD